MRSKRHTYFVLIAIFIFLVYILYPTDKKRIKRVIEKGRQAVIAEDIDQLMEQISFHFRDEYGGSYLLFKKRAERAFNIYSDIEVTADVMAVSVHGEYAAADVKVSVIASNGNDRGYLIGDAEGARNIKIFLNKSPYLWKVTKIEGVAD